jgi:hypothetical protein
MHTGMLQLPESQTPDGLKVLVVAAATLKLRTVEPNAEKLADDDTGQLLQGSRGQTMRGMEGHTRQENRLLLLLQGSRGQTMHGME